MALRNALTNPYFFGPTEIARWVIACFCGDGLKAFPKALKIIYPMAVYNPCSVHIQLKPLKLRSDYVDFDTSHPLLLDMLHTLKVRCKTHDQFRAVGAVCVQQLQNKAGRNKEASNLVESRPGFKC